MTSLAVAIGFLTILPVPERAWRSPGSFGRAFAWFPLVGLVLGALLASAALVMLSVLPVSVVAALVLALSVLLTGGLHLDGLMDACDGLLCVRSPQERLAIMRDSHVGAFGVLGAGCLLLVKFAALSSLVASPRDLLIAALLLAPLLSRWAMVIATVCFPYGRTGESLGSTFRRTAGPAQLVAATLIAFLSVPAICVVIHLRLSAGFTLFAGVAALTYGLARFALTRLPGLTGDVYGAINEVVEAAVLVAMTVHWRF